MSGVSKIDIVQYERDVPRFENMDIDSYNKPRDACPVCGSNKYSTIFKQSFAHIDGVDLFDSYDVCACSYCRMVFANHIPSQGNIDMYYSHNNKYEQPEIRLYLHQQAIYEYIFNNCKNDVAIYDFGCGRGLLLRKLRENGFNNLTAIDTSATNCEELRELGITAVNCSAFDFVVPETRADIIMCLAVLEHIVDLKAFVSQMLSALAENGKVIIHVPQIIPEYAIEKPFQQLSTEHVNFFTRGSLIKLFALYDMVPETDIVIDKENPIIFKRVAISDGQSKMELYVQKSHDALRLRWKILKDKLNNKAKYIVYGCGTLTRLLLAAGFMDDMNIIAFADGDKHYCGKCLNGIPIVEPQALLHMPDASIVICTYLANDEIEKFLRDELLVRNEVIKF